VVARDGKVILKDGKVVQDELHCCSGAALLDAGEVRKWETRGGGELAAGHWDPS